MIDLRTIEDDVGMFSVSAIYDNGEYKMPSLTINTYSLPTECWDNPVAIEDVFKILKSNTWSIDLDEESEVIKWLREDFEKTGLVWNTENLTTLRDVLEYASNLKMF